MKTFERHITRTTDEYSMLARVSQFIRDISFARSSKPNMDLPLDVSKSDLSFSSPTQTNHIRHEVPMPFNIMHAARSTPGL